MSSDNKILEFEVVQYDLSRRVGRLESDTAAMSKSLKEIQDQVIVYNTNLDRFWQHEWPTVHKSITETNAKLASFAEAAIDEKVKSAVEAERGRNENAARLAETTQLKKDVESQKNFLMKMVMAAAGGGGAATILTEVLTALFKPG